MKFIAFLLAATAFSKGAAQGSRSFQHSLESTAAAVELWGWWTNVSLWKEWDSGLRSASLEGDFKLGARGVLVSDKGQKVPFTVSEFAQGEGYAIAMKLPLGKMTVRRWMESKEAGLEFTHQVVFSGFSKGFFFRILGRGYAKKLPGAMEKLRELAESHS